MSYNMYPSHLDLWDDWESGDSAGQPWVEGEDGEWGDLSEEVWESAPNVSPGTALMFGMGLFLVLMLFLQAVRAPRTADAAEAASDRGAVAAAPSDLAPGPDPYAFAAPYENYVITQGIHGASYGDMAVDLAAGKGAVILSPINGAVTERYTDPWGNPTLILENEVYRVKLLHGDYSVEVGDVVALGDPVGYESNKGYTTNMRGERCINRPDPCGYHSHLNVFNKEKGENVNPLHLIAAP